MLILLGSFVIILVFATLVVSIITFTAIANAATLARVTICTRNRRPFVERRMWCVKIAPNTNASTKNAA